VKSPTVLSRKLIKFVGRGQGLFGEDDREGVEVPVEPGNPPERCADSLDGTVVRRRRPLAPVVGVEVVPGRLRRPAAYRAAVCGL
jgi:hypothetical protein